MTDVVADVRIDNVAMLIAVLGGLFAGVIAGMGIWGILFEWGMLESQLAHPGDLAGSYMMAVLGVPLYLIAIVLFYAAITEEVEHE